MRFQRSFRTLAGAKAELTRPLQRFFDTVR